MTEVRILNNRYQILSVIKEGGFGIIYKGYDNVLGKDVTIKEIKPELLGDPNIIEQFKSEARHVAKMNHQNIVHIFDFVQEEGNFYIIMEYIDGLDLSALIQNCMKKGTFIPQHITLHIIAEVCKALDYAHNCRNTDNNEPLNLVHQDISPSNIMISKTGQIKVIDFGLTGTHEKKFADDTLLFVRGKLQYMSPEHVNNEQKLDRRSDIFSLGLVLYEALEGKRFFHLQSAQKIIETLRNGKLKVRDLRLTPKPLRKIVKKALEKSPDERYQNSNLFFIDLVTHLASTTDITSIDSELINFIRQHTQTNGSSRSPLADEKPDILDSLLEEYDNEADNLERPPEEMTSARTLEKKLRPAVEPAAGILTDKQADSITSYFEGEDDVKTIIDVIRLSERGNKKSFVRGGIAAAGLLILFFFLDIAFQWTASGTALYDFIFPPAIKITSVPSGAKVYLNEKIQAGATPITIDKIQPGVYQLKLTIDKYNPIVKSLLIPSKGDIKILGEQSRHGNQPYNFKFKTNLELTSTPPDAQVFINNIKYGLNTPCSITWEVGETCEIELRKAGFKDLTGFSLDTENMIEEIDDRRIWKFEIEEKPTVRYKLAGLFWKHITINSKPSNAEIYLDGNTKSIGKTGINTKVFLTALSHKLVIKKKRYNSKTITLNVNESTPEEIFATLTRPVRFLAYDATNGKDKDLGAIVSRLKRNGKTVMKGRRTPFKINLQAENYTAVFSKEGFKDVTVKIVKNDEAVVAKLEPLEGQFSIIILDDELNLPISAVEIRFKSLDDPGNSKMLFAITDSEGTCTGGLMPGLYVLQTRKNGYAYQEKSVMIEASDLNLIELTLRKL
ncbi:serine/threonine protein kinase [candidate division KSB1 bacterium]|nr:serine/threonine protein kinase [candidate division KSB1 bacterium]